MAEGWSRHLRGEVVAPFSAGIAPKGLDPIAVEVMATAGVDISSQRSKHIDEVASVIFDWVVTVCGNAEKECPVFPGRTRVVHKGFDDPPMLSVKTKNLEETLKHYARVRDEIRDFVTTLPEGLKYLYHGHT